ncbi:MAG: hypothetical protein HQ525_01585, partial [Anaerolineae bacterium]|nr:hypothetical protein [Anaerolineae bacterium]
LGFIAIGFLLVYLIPTITNRGLSAPAEITFTADASIALPAVANTPSPTLIPTPTPIPLPYSWVRLNSGQFLPRDQITAIVVDPTDPGIVYVGTNNAGIYKSINGGVSWEPIQNGLGVASISSLVIDSHYPSTLYASVEYFGVYKTVDGGQSWQSASQGLKNIQSLTYLEMDLKNPLHMFFSAFAVIYETVDGGKSWKEVPIHQDCSQSKSSLVFAPDKENLIFAIEGGWFDCKAGLYRSEDGGENWSYFPIIGSELISPETLAIDAVSSDILYVTDRDEQSVYVSQDGGRNWVKTLSRSCVSLITHPEKSQVAYCGTDQIEIFKTSDGGLTWQVLSNKVAGLEKIKVLAIKAGSPETVLIGGEGLIVMGENDSQQTESNSGMGSTRSELIIQSDSFYIQSISNTNSFQLSLDEGRSWTSISSPSDFISVGAEDALYVIRDQILGSADRGQSWENFSAPHFLTGYARIFAHPTRSEHLYVLHAEESLHTLYLSQDGGDTWKTSIGDLTNVPWMKLALFFGGDDDQRMYALTQDSLYITDNGGLEWARCPDGVKVNSWTLSNTSIVINPQNNDQIYLATSGDGVQFSNDGCQSWQSNNNGLKSLFVNTLAMDPNNPNTLYAGTDGGAFISSDSGETWGEVNDGLLGATVVYSIAVDEDSNVYAATPYGIFHLERK